MTNYHLPKHLFFILLAVIIGVWGGGGCCSVEDTPSNNNEAKETSANYTVMHYQQNANDDKYTAVENDTETLTGTVGSETTAAAKSYAGFTAKEFAQVKIAADGSTTVKIYYDRKMVTLTLNCDNGTAAKTITGKFGADVKISAPTKTGYTFAAWNPELPATFPAEDAQYTAKWVKEGDYIITYKNTENAVNDNPAGYSVETETITLKAATKVGYALEGWYKEDSFATKVTEITKGSTGNITLYAKWKLETYSITYELNSGTNADENPESYNVETETITLKEATKVGYVFDGWYKEDSFATKVTEIAKGSTGNITLYAKWIITADTVADAIGALSGEGPHDIAVVGEITTDTILVIRAALNKNITAKVNLDLSQTIGLTSIGETFHGCSNLTSVTIPDGVTSIGNHAFHDCTSLTIVNIPDSVTSIGGGAFFNCINLTSVIIPDGVTSIGYVAFSGCSKLTSVNIPDSVTFIGGSAFINCLNLTNVIIPDGVTSIGSYAFYSCSSLKFNEFDNAKYLGNENNPYFVLIEAKDKSITSCNINTATKMITGSAFINCSSLTSVTIPDSVTFIDGDAFEGCSNLKFNDFDNAKYLGKENNLYFVLIKAKDKSITSCNINTATKMIAGSAFNGCRSLTSVTIPDSVTYIGYDTFSGCSKLTSVNIPDSVTFIGGSAFINCLNLTNVIIPDGVTSIGSYAFYSCSSLTSVTIPDSVTSIGYDTFSGCSNLTTVNYTGSEEQWNVIKIGNNNDSLTGANINYNYTGE